MNSENPRVLGRTENLLTNPIGLWTAIEFVLLSFNCSKHTCKSQRMKLLDVINTCNQLSVNALD